MRERGQRPDLRERTRQWQATALQEKLDAEPDYARAFAEHTRAAKARYLARTPPEQIAETKRASRGRARLRKLMEMFNGQR